MSQLFERIVQPLATPQTPGAFLGGLRVMAIDGTVLDVPDSKANARVFGYPATRPGTQAAFPKVRLVLLIEAGTHLIVDGNDSVPTEWESECERKNSCALSRLECY